MDNVVRVKSFCKHVLRVSRTTVFLWDPIICMSLGAVTTYACV